MCYIYHQVELMEKLSHENRLQFAPREKLVHLNSAIYAGQTQPFFGFCFCSFSYASIQK